MPKFRRKPVVVEAVQLQPETWLDVCVFADVGLLAEGKSRRTWSLTTQRNNRPGFGRSIFLELVMTTPAEDLADVVELQQCLRLLLRQCRRSVNLPDMPDLLCAIDKQTVARAEKALRAQGVTL